MIKKTIKYLLWTLLLLLLLLLGLAYYVLYTASGSQRLLDYGLQRAGLDVRYQQVTGSLAQGMQFTQLSYEAPGVHLVAGHISYQANWSWFDWHLDLPQVRAAQLRVSLSSDSSQPTTTEPFAGFELPLSIELQALAVDDLLVVTDGVALPPVQLELAATMHNSAAEVKLLNLLVEQARLQVTGSLDFHAGLSYDLNTHWQQQLPDQEWLMQGQFTGDLSSITTNQWLDFTAGQLTGQLQLDGSVSELTAVPTFDLKWQADELIYDSGDQAVGIEAISGQVTGGVDDYVIQLDGRLQHAQLSSSQLKLQGRGSRTQLNAQSLQISTPEGVIDLAAEVNWQDALQLNGQLMLDAFNPAQLLPAWSGTVNGHMDVMVQLDNQDYRIITRNNQVHGNLKNLPFDLSGGAQWVNGALQAEQLRLSLGENHLFVDGEISEQLAALTLRFDWQDLSLLAADLSGAFTADLALSGAPLTPTFDLQLAGQNLVYNDSQVSSLVVSSQGVWNQTADTQVTMGPAQLAGVGLSALELQQSGWLAAHTIKAAWTQEQLSSRLELQGQYQSVPSDQWSGQLVAHEIQFSQDHQLTLQQPIDLSYAAADFTVAPACWQGDDLGQLCVELQRQSQTDALHAVVSLDDFSLSPWQAWLPGNLSVLGELQGQADLQLADDELSVTADFSVLDGTIAVNQAEETIYQAATELLQLKIQSSGLSNLAQLDLQLATGDYLRAEGRLDTPANQAWQIDAQFSGEFKDPTYLAALSEEISAIQGQVNLAGEVTGDLVAPIIKLRLTQPQGHVKLTRLGAAIEDLQLAISTQGFQRPRYQIQLSGKNTPSINQGQIRSEGELLLGPSGWQYQGKVSGENFLLMNLPEIKFKVSPDLNILADQQQLDIRGDVLIPYGHVLIEQLPASTVTNSADLVIHAETEERAVNYPVTMQINARIEDRIELDVIGLQADLTGGIQLRQDGKQVLQGFGELNLLDGSYEIYGQKLNITAGELTFSGPLDNPRLDVKASRASISGDVVAGVELGGTVNNLQSQLFSEPNLPEIEKLSYIMTGRGINNGGNLDGESLKQAAIVLGLNQSSPIFNQIQSQFGIDVLTIKESAVAADTVVEAGKKINDRLYVSYNQGLFNRLGFWVLKYRINQFLNLQTTQGENQSIELVYTRRAKTPDDEQP